MRWVKLSAVGLVVLSIVCFTIQNSSRTTELSLDLYVGAWKLVDPAPVPMLMWACFLGGAVAAWALGVRRTMVLSRRVRQLEQEMALSGRSAGGSGGTRSTAADSAPPKDGWA